MPWWQWVVAWLGFCAFVVLGTIGRSRYVDDMSWGEALTSGLGGIALATVAVLVTWVAR